MSCKLIFLLLTAFLVVQSSVGNPMPNADTATEVSKEEDIGEEYKDEDSSDSTNQEESEELALFLLVEFTEFTYVTLETGKKLMKEVVADINSMEGKSVAPTIKTDKLIKFVNKLDKIDLNRPIALIDRNVGRNLLLLNEMENLLYTINTTRIEKPNDEDLIIEASLKKHGIENIVEELKVKFLGFTKRFYVVADNFWNSLSPEEQAERIQFAEWLKLFKEETDNEKKIMLFEQIIELNEQSE